MGGEGVRVRQGEEGPIQQPGQGGEFLKNELTFGKIDAKGLPHDFQLQKREDDDNGGGEGELLRVDSFFATGPGAGSATKNEQDY